MIVLPEKDEDEWYEGYALKDPSTKREIQRKNIVYDNILQFSGLKSILSCLPLFEISTCTGVNNF